MVAGKGVQAESFRKNLQSKPIGRQEFFSQTFLINHVEYFSVPTFCGGFCKSWRKKPVVDDALSSHQQEIYLTASLDENCIEIEFQTERNYYFDLRQTYSVLKLKLARGRVYETYNTIEVKQEHKKS